MDRTEDLELWQIELQMQLHLSWNLGVGDNGPNSVRMKNRDPSAMIDNLEIYRRLSKS